MAVHLAALTELSHEPATTGAGGYPTLNRFGVSGCRAKNIEDFVGSELCVMKLQTIAARSVMVQAHAGNLSKAAKLGGSCVNGSFSHRAQRAFVLSLQLRR